MRNCHRLLSSVSALCALWLIVALTSCSGNANKSPSDSLQSSNRQTPEPASGAPMSGPYSLNVEFVGPWGFAQYPDGTILAIAPALQGHENAHAFGLNQETTLDAGDYDSTIVGLSPVAASVSTQVNPQATGIIYTVDVNAGHVDPNKQRFIAIRLPKPKQILPRKGEHSVIIEHGASLPEDVYAVSLYIRYDVASLSGTVFKLSGKKNFDADAAQAGNEGFIAIGIGPDSPSHPDSQKAFQALGKLFGLTLGLGDVSGAALHSAQKAVATEWLLPSDPFAGTTLFSIPGKDCKAPEILARVK